MRNKAKSDTLVAYMTNQLGLPEYVVRARLSAIRSTLEKGLVQNGKVTIRKFGSFRISITHDRKVVIPGRETSIKSKSVRIVFRPSRKLLTEYLGEKEQ